ncbi:MAG: FAD-binding oxidoreductase [Elusimicrobiota bacterium]
MNPSIIQKLIGYLGKENVLCESGELLSYSFDAALDRSIPSVVVIPQNADQVQKVVQVFVQNKIPYVARGAATSLCGGPIPLNGAAVIAMARFNKFGKLDKERKELIVEPGVINLKIQEYVATSKLFYPPDPGSQKACTIGGNIATNAGGPHCLKYGVTSQFILGLDVVLPNGNLIQTSLDDPGYDLTGLFVGSEGTLGVVTKAKLKLLPQPEQVKTMLVSFPSIESAIQAVSDIIAAGVLPATLEAMDQTIVRAVEAFIHAGYPVDAEAVLLIEVDGSKEDSLETQVYTIQKMCENNGAQEFRFAKDEEERKKLWEGRRGSYAAMARLAPNVLVEDGAVPRTKLPEALKKIKEIAQAAKLKVALLFHAGDGNLHPQIIFDERDIEQTKRVKEAGHLMLKACVDLGGTISGEHGVGIDKREAMKWLFSRETLSLFRRIKHTFDPANLCNPDKLIPLVGKVAPEVPRESSADLVAIGKFSPATEPELIDTIRSAAHKKTPFGVQGTTSRYRLKETLIVSMKQLNKIIDFDKGNLTLTIQSGALLAEARREVEAAGQFLWVAGGGSIGGVLATRQSVAPSLRDLVLGMRVLLPTGEVVQLGAKTMKNVAGYDVPKLMIGSWGTLGIILDVTFRLYSFAQASSKSVKTTPFVFREIHKKIKSAFDPVGLMAPRLTTLTNEEIAQKPEGESSESEISSDALKKISDKFWNS